MATSSLLPIALSSKQQQLRFVCLPIHHIVSQSYECQGKVVMGSRTNTHATASCPSHSPVNADY